MHPSDDGVLEQSQAGMTSMGGPVPVTAATAPGNDIPEAPRCGPRDFP